MVKQRSAAPNEALKGSFVGCESFSSHEDMADSLEALLSFLAKRDRLPNEPKASLSLLGFALERLTVEFSSDVHTIEVQTRFADGTACVLVPSRDQETDDEKQARVLVILDRLMPALKETHLRVAVQLYYFLNSKARQRLVEDFRRRTGDAL